MLRFEDAIAIVHHTVSENLASSTSTNNSERVSLGKASGRIADVSVSLDHPVPDAHTSIKDGYAIRSADTPGTLSLISRPVFAAAQPTTDITSPSSDLEPGSAVYIATGGVLPRSADAIVEIERAELLIAGDGTKSIKVGAELSPGEDVRAPGSDAKVGEEIICKGQVIRPAHIGLLAMAGHPYVQVAARPLVAIVATGDELVDPVPNDNSQVNSLMYGQIYDANRPMLLALAQDPIGANARVLDLGIVRDTRSSSSSSSSSNSETTQNNNTRSPIDLAIDRAIEANADVLITSGGVSVGERDLVRPTLEKRGIVHFSKLSLKPGKPTTFATIPCGSTSSPRAPLLVFALPGNPCSAFVMFNILALPALIQLSKKNSNGDEINGSIESARPCQVPCVIATDMRRDSSRVEYHRVRLALSENGSELMAHSTGIQRSSRLMSLKGAVALVAVKAGQGVLPAGSKVNAIVIDDLRAATVLKRSGNGYIGVEFGPTKLGNGELWVVNAGGSLSDADYSINAARCAICSHAKADMNLFASNNNNATHLADINNVVSFQRWIDANFSAFAVVPRVVVLLVPANNAAAQQVVLSWIRTSSRNRVADGFGERMREAASAAGDIGTGLLGSDCVAVCPVNGRQCVVVCMSVPNSGAIDLGVSLKARIGVVWNALGQLTDDVSDI